MLDRRCRLLVAMQLCFAAKMHRGRFPPSQYLAWRRRTSALAAFHGTPADAAWAGVQRMVKQPCTHKESRMALGADDGGRIGIPTLQRTAFP